MWTCTKKNNEIEVETPTKKYGAYKLLTGKVCEVCSYPNYTADECPYHEAAYGFDRLYAMGVYDKNSDYHEDLLKAHILGLKKWKFYGPPLGIALAICIDQNWVELKNSDYIIPVPKLVSEYKIDQEHNTKYNQAEVIAQAISMQTGIPMNTDLIKIDEVSLRDAESSYERYEMVQGSYGISPLANFTGKKIILVDDVATALATTSECSQVLINAGAKEVNVIVAGRNVFSD